MFDTIFCEVSFDTGWYKNDSIVYCGKQYEIYVCAKSYRKTDLITDNQRTAYKTFTENKSAIENEIKDMLVSYKNEEFLDLLQPTGLIFKRDGEYALTWGSAPQPIGLVRLTGEMNPPLRTAPSRRYAAHIKPSKARFTPKTLEASICHVS